MHKIDSDGATVANRFTEGSVVLSVPATVVSAAIMNSIQTEIVNVVEAAGLTLETSGSDSEDQLLEALEILISFGGSITPITQTIANNQASPQDVLNFPVWLSTAVIAHEFLFHILRRTDTQHVVESGRVYVIYDAEDDDFHVTLEGVNDDSGVDFSVVTTGNADEYKLQYTSDDLTGATYSGILKITDIKKVVA